MQYSLPLDTPNQLVRINRRLTATYGPQPMPFRLDPVSQLILTMLGARTYDEVSSKAFTVLLKRFTCWEELAESSPDEIKVLISEVTFAERKAAFLPAALKIIIARRGRLDLSFLSNWPTTAAIAWLEALPGVGPKTSAAVLNLSTLHRAVLVVDTTNCRVAQRTGLIPETANLERASLLLARLVPNAWTADDTEGQYFLGKKVGKTHCRFHKPLCGSCPLESLCRHAAALHSLFGHSHPARVSCRAQQ